MMNFHFKQKDELLSQLYEVDRDLTQKRRELEARQKLQAEFYQDSNNQPIGQIQKPVIGQRNQMALADEIMNDLLKQDLHKKIEEKKEPLLKNNLVFEEPPIAQEKLKRSPPKRQNNFINQREIQKNKLQNQQYGDYFPFGKVEKRLPSYQKQTAPIIPEPDKPSESNKNNRSISPSPINPHFNPFVPDEQSLRLKKQEQMKEYKRVLQEQMQIENMRKQQEKKEKTEYNRKFHQYSAANTQLNAPVNPAQTKPTGAKKKVDPNGSHPFSDPSNYAFAKSPNEVKSLDQSEKAYMKLKVEEIRNRYKKGRIDLEEFQAAIKKLESHYKCKIEQVDLNIRKVESSDNQLEQRHEEHTHSPPKRDDNKVEQTSLLQARQSAHQNYTIHSQNHSKNYPQSSTQHPYGVPPQPQTVSNQNMQLMRLMFQQIRQMRQLYKSSFVNEKQFLQETFSKLLSQQQQNQIMTQQNPSSTHQPKEFHTDKKQYRTHKQHINEKVLPSDSSASHIHQSDSSYIDKSLSAVASKIPLTSKQIQMEKSSKKGTELKISQFFTKKYKIKASKQFTMIIDANQSQFIVPSVSNFIDMKNGKQQLRKIFEQDLVLMRKMQSKKDIKELRDRVAKVQTYNTKGSESSNVVKRLQHQNDLNPSKRVGSNQYQHQSELTTKPFLKKHISTDEYNILTFNEQDIQMNSPSPIYPKQNNYSPKMKSQILEQDEYQTQPRQRQSEQKKIIQNQQNARYPSSKIMNVIKSNNELLSKYQINSSYSKIEENIDHSNHSKDYFSNHSQISPVKKGIHQYEESIETVKSEEESVQKLKFKQERNVNALNPRDSMRYSQTVESVEESSARLNRPPLAKKKSTSRKKESSISRSKIEKSNISSNPPQTHEYPHSESERLESVKLDSHVYDSYYEESVGLDHKLRQMQLQMQKSPPLRQPEIKINAPVIVVAPKYPLKNQISEEHRAVKPPNKWTPLQEARNIAQELRAKKNDESANRSLIQQKLSELESFVKKQESVLSVKKPQIKEIPRDLSQKKEKKKDIMKLLDELDEDSEYQQDFHSYHEQSEGH